MDLRTALLAAALSSLLSAANSQAAAPALPYPVVDTGQAECFDNHRKIPAPTPGEPFYGQDAQFTRNTPSYTDNGDGTVTDNVTGLMWQKGFSVMSNDEAVEKLKTFSLAGHNDWRLPSMKQLYSLVLFSGVDASGRDMSQVPAGAKPFLDTRYFDFKYGANGQRIIDTQLVSSTVYRGKTMGGQPTVFGLNAADGRIKGYPLNDPRSRTGKKFTVRFVRGNPGYGNNDFHDNGDGTVTDRATGLMWEKAGSAESMNWPDALARASRLNKEKHLGYSDWRLPDAKELQSLLDYSRSPQATDSPAIDPVFETPAITDEAGKKNYPFYWTSTTHQSTRGADAAVYVCFGEALGFFSPPRPGARPGPGPGPEPGPGGGENSPAIDVHGAGAQRSDPKTGNPKEFPRGRGPQGDVIRILNHVRLVRDDTGPATSPP